jgi:hypothetical protein
MKPRTLCYAILKDGYVQQDSNYKTLEIYLKREDAETVCEEGMEIISCNIEWNIPDEIEGEYEDCI